MNTHEAEYMNLHLQWRNEINPTEDIQIDETVFDEIYRMQEDERCREDITRKTI